MIGTHKCSACRRETIPGATEVSGRLVLENSLCTFPCGDPHSWVLKYSQGGVLPTFPIVSTIEVDEIPQTLLEYTSKGSVHASSIVQGSESERRETFVWISQNIVDTIFFTLEHDYDSNPKNSFEDYIGHFKELGYSVWDLDNQAIMDLRIKFVQRDDPNRYFDLSGQPNWIISPSYDHLQAPISRSDYLATARGIIVIQSKHRDEDIPLCELELKICMLLMMNKMRLPALFGFLVQDNGMCRTFQAIRGIGAMLEQDDLVHVSHIATVLHNLWQTI